MRVLGVMPGVQQVNRPPIGVREPELHFSYFLHLPLSVLFTCAMLLRAVVGLLSSRQACKRTSFIQQQLLDALAAALPACANPLVGALLPLGARWGTIFALCVPAHSKRRRRHGGTMTE